MLRFAERPKMTRAQTTYIVCQNDDGRGLRILGRAGGDGLFTWGLLGASMQ